MTGMNRSGISRRHSRALGAALAAGAVLTASATLGAGPAVAADDDALDVVNTETIQVYTDGSGDVDSSRVYEQLTLTGDGSAQIVNPIETTGLRNLDGFGGVTVDDGAQQIDVDVDGVERLRSVSTYEGDLPLDLAVEYRLDGEPVEPGDVVGSAGLLEVLYTVRNVTSEPTEVSFPDGKGGTMTETVDVPIPVVGSLTTIAPSSFSDVRSETGNIAGDGKGGTKLSFTMTLFPPLGSDTAKFGYTAQIADGVVPDASISALPVNPLDSPTFASAADSYQNGADTGAELAAGATEIDANLLKLRDGASELLGGLIQLREGADELNAGLAGEAAPGARLVADGSGELESGLTELKAGTSRLQDGASELDAGAGQLGDGANRLDAGASQLAGGTGEALTGSRKLQGGLQRISGGLDELSGKLPGAQAGITQLQQGVDLLLAGFGDTSDPDSLIGGLERLEVGAGQLRGGLGQLRGDGSAGNPGLVGAKGGVDQVRAGLAGAVASNDLENGLNAVKANFCATHPAPAQCNGLIDQILAGVSQSKADLGAAVAGLDQVSGGLGSAITALDAQLIPGADQIVAGLGSAQAGAVDLKAGVGQVDGGLTELETGITSAVEGVFQLSDGAQSAASGSGDLADGLSQLDGGASELAAGTGELAQGTSDLQDGTGQLASGSGELDAGAGAARDGAGQLSDGASELAGGLDAAADGSGQLADGLGEAAGGAPALVDGAQRLSDEGTSELIKAGEETTQDYGQLYAVIDAAAERADAEKMAYGAPQGAAGLTAYSYELVGDDGEGGRNLARGLGAAVLAAAGVAGLGLRRRLI